MLLTRSFQLQRAIRQVEKRAFNSGMAGSAAISLWGLSGIGSGVAQKLEYAIWFSTALHLYLLILIIESSQNYAGFPQSEAGGYCLA